MLLFMRLEEEKILFLPSYTYHDFTSEKQSFKSVGSFSFILFKMDSANMTTNLFRPLKL